MGLALNNANYPSIAQGVVAGYPFTLCGWFRVPAVSLFLPLMGMNDTTAGVRYELYYSGHTTGQIGANAYDGGSAVAISGVAATPEVWFHAAGVFASETDRRVYLDGGNLGTNATSRSWSGTNLLYAGNRNNSTAVDVAEAAVFAAALSGADAAALANGVSPLALARSRNLVVYQDLITRLNRPGLGPTLSAAAGASYVGHPRMLYGGPRQRAGRIRVLGPWRLGGLQFAASGVTAGQTFVAGAAGDSQRTFGEVIS